MKDLNDKRTRDAFSQGWGGARPGAGRKKLAKGEAKESRVIRVPVSAVPVVRALIEGQAAAVPVLESVRAIVDAWRVQAEAHDSQPRWVNVAKLLSELRAVLDGGN